MQAIILAGGAGTRLRSVSGTLPKPLVTVRGETLLGRQLSMLARQGFEGAIVLAGHTATPDARSHFDQIVAYCGDGSKWGLRLECLNEEQPLGTAGAILRIAKRLQSSFAVLYGDTVLEVNLVRMWRAHRKAKAGATLFVHPNDHPHDSDLIEVTRDSMVSAFHSPPHSPMLLCPNLVNAALYLLDRSALEKLDGLKKKVDFAKDVFPHMLAKGIPLLAYRSPEYIKDAGTPERLTEVSRDIACGRVAGRSLANVGSAVFIDRDGVLNAEIGRICNPQDLQLLPGAADAVRRLNLSQYRAICVTNQPVIARGDVSWCQLAKINGRLDSLLGQSGGYLERMYICPHHPDKGFQGECPEYKIICDCRKPATGLMVQAAVDFNLDLATCWMIGDQTSDMELARRAGMRSILVRSGYAGKDGKYDARSDFVADNLASAVDIILKLSPK